MVGAIFLKLLLVIICGIGGYLISSQTEALWRFSWAPWAGAGAGVAFGLIALFVENFIKRIPLKSIFGGTIGLVIGLIIAKLIASGFTGVEKATVRIAIYIILACSFGYIGIALGTIKIEEVGLPNFSFFGRSSGRAGLINVLDTSVIIDGRVADVVETGFMAGTLVIPDFVLQELQHIADSSEPSRRARGRRGLDIVKRLQESNIADVQINHQDFENIQDVDSKLVALALRLNGRIVTNDYNLSKVAELQGIRVLNLNQLANAMKPVVLPGEVLRLQIVKEGKEQGQGVSYLEDGTMVVVENASRLLGKEVDVSVTSILQTTAGRLIFTQLKDGEQHYQQGRRN
jgi:uncharacterized protein YacL